MPKIVNKYKILKLLFFLVSIAMLFKLVVFYFFYGKNVMENIGIMALFIEPIFLLIGVLYFYLIDKINFIDSFLIFIFSNVIVDLINTNFFLLYKFLKNERIHMELSITRDFYYSYYITIVFFSFILLYITRTIKHYAKVMKKNKNFDKKLKQ